MIRRLAAAAFAVFVTGAAGCCDLAHLVCPCPPPIVCPPGALTRDTPDHAVDFLIDAFRNRRVGDIYESFHPDFIHENGDFPASDFDVAYHRYEEDFTADALSLISATRAWLPPQHVRDRETGADLGLLAFVKMVNLQTGAQVLFALKNRPKIRIVTTDRFVRTIGPVPFDKEGLVRLENGHLSLPADFDLASIENMHRETFSGIKSSDVVSVEIADDWQVRFVPQDKARNIRFIDKLKELTRK